MRTHLSCFALPPCRCTYVTWWAAAPVVQLASCSMSASSRSTSRNGLAPCGASWGCCAHGGTSPSSTTAAQVKPADGECLPCSKQCKADRTKLTMCRGLAGGSHHCCAASPSRAHRPSPAACCALSLFLLHCVLQATSRAGCCWACRCLRRTTQSSRQQVGGWGWGGWWAEVGTGRCCELQADCRMRRGDARSALWVLAGCPWPAPHPPTRACTCLPALHPPALPCLSGLQWRGWPSTSPSLRLEARPGTCSKCSSAELAWPGLS